MSQANEDAAPRTRALPADRSEVLTEQRNPDSMDLHRRPVRECLQVLQRADRKAVQAVAEAEEALAQLIEAAEPGFLRGGRLIYLGAGTSGRLGVLDASEAPPTFDVARDRIIGLIAGGERALRQSSEALEDDPAGARAELEALAPTANDTFVAIAAGGSTPYALGGLIIAKELAPEAVTALLCCTPVAKPPGCEHLIEVLTGPEVLTGSTRMKAGTATKLVLNALSTTLMVRAGRVYENLMVELRATNEKLADRAARIITALVDVDRARAFDLLARADGEVKVAIVMGRRAVDAQGARELLAAVDGRMEQVIDSRA